MGNVPLISIHLKGDETLYIENALYHARVPLLERLHSKRITIEYFPEERRAEILVVKCQEKNHE